MDFSLLVGVTRKSFDVLGEEDSSSRSSSSIPSSRAASPIVIGKGAEDLFLRDEDGGMDAVVVHGPATYYFGIIDILQQWNWRKKAERLFKTVCLRLDGDGISAIDPKRYSARFMIRCVVDVFANLQVNAVDDGIPKKISRNYRVSLSRESDASRSASMAVDNSSGINRRQLPVRLTEGSEELDIEHAFPSDSSDTEESIEKRHSNAWGKSMSHDV